jgi:hypothetical protein
MFFLFRTYNRMRRFGASLATAEGFMTAWKVDKAVGNVKNDSPGLIKPLQDSSLG